MTLLWESHKCSWWYRRRSWQPTGLKMSTDGKAHGYLTCIMTSFCCCLFVCQIHSVAISVRCHTCMVCHTCNVWGARVGVLPAVLLAQRVIVDGVLHWGSRQDSKTWLGWYTQHTHTHTHTHTHKPDKTKSCIKGMKHILSWLCNESVIMNTVFIYFPERLSLMASLAGGWGNMREVCNSSVSTTQSAGWLTHSHPIMHLLWFFCMSFCYYGRERGRERGREGERMKRHSHWWHLSSA